MISRILKIAFIGVMVVCLFLIGQAHYDSVRNQRKQQALRKMVEAASQEQSGSAEEDSGATEPETASAATEAAASQEPVEQPVEEPAILPQYEALYQANSDLIGWLSIEGMVIDYPVMRSEDDEFYLHHNFQGEEDKYGCLYVRNRADVDTPGVNFLIYGHNMKDGSMFGDLDLYRKKSFYDEHRIICFDTLYEERRYEIVAVFLSQVYEEQDEVFKYYQFYEAETEEEFLDFYDNIKELSLYDTGVTAEYGDTFLTLSTCAYHVPDGRLAVVAKRI
ncbi:MAG: class B sortase [bacterium]|nr:class B sortase [bacterium]MCM1375507.1 class B sortase [Muribaculum sp.]